LGTRLMVEPEAVILKSDDKTLRIERATGLILLNGEPQHADPPAPPPMVVDSQLLVPLRAVAEAFGARLDYENSGSVPVSRFSYRDGVQLQRGEQRLWVPIYEQSPAVMTAVLTDLDRVIPGTYGDDWYFLRRESFDGYTIVSIQLIAQGKSQRFLLRRAGTSWLNLSGEDGQLSVEEVERYNVSYNALIRYRSRSVAGQYIKRVMAGGNAASWRRALLFLTSDSKPALPAGLETIDQTCFKPFSPVIRKGEAGGNRASARKLRREQSAFYAWFVRNYSGKAPDQALATALYQQGMVSWALGDVQAARQAFRQLLQKYGKAIREYGPNGPVTYRQSLTQHRWVTVARRTPVYQYGARDTPPGPPVLLKQVRVEPGSTLLVAYSISELDGGMEEKARPFFQKHLKLWEGSLVVPKRNCVSLAEFSLRSRGR
ncbi:MAG TPA: stalk domain-containing protein, partial [Abditibacteriaceae bacterium]|nr:stalk domain-containing protein [Abditibacteriaceae bacterium]